VIRVLLADDEAVVRAGIRTVLASDPQLRVVAEASNGRQAVELACLHTPDLAVVDIRMPVLDGLSATAELRARVPETGVLLLTTFGEDDYIARGLEHGANGFVLKASDPQHLLAGVRAVAAGGAYLSPEVAMRVITGLRHGRSARWSTARDRIEVLSPREREVLALIGEGLSNAQIAQRLHLVEGTVKGYVSTILDRLDVRNRVQAALIAYDAGLVDEA
jgi:DNA-binding NarL/FixJ family response regulator